MPRELIDPRQLLVEVARILKKFKISYIVTGGIAVLIWGRPRFTADIDIVIELDKKNIDNLAKSLMALGEFGYIDRGAIEEALLGKGEFNFIDGNTGVKVDFWVLNRNDAFDRSRIKRRVSRRILGETVHFTSPEDLILIKLLWSKDSQSTRQLEDVESIFKISRKKLDMKYIRQWAKKVGVLDILNRVIKKK